MKPDHGLPSYSAAYGVVDPGEDAARPVVRLLNLIISEAILSGASQIRFDSGPDKCLVQYYTDSWRDVMTLPGLAARPLLARLRAKVLATSQGPGSSDGDLHVAGGGREVALHVTLSERRVGVEEILLQLPPGMTALSRLPQRGLERLADSIERAGIMPLLAAVAKPLFILSWPSLPVSLLRSSPRVRVKTQDARQFEFNASAVDLDRGEMVGSATDRSSVRLTLGDIENVWLRRPRPARFTMLWLGTIGATVLAGAIFSPAAPFWAWAAVGCLPAGVLAWLLQNWRAMHRWDHIFERPAAQQAHEPDNTGLEG
jgi:hypothetical protein